MYLDCVLAYCYYTLTDLCSLEKGSGLESVPNLSLLEMLRIKEGLIVKSNLTEEARLSRRKHFQLPGTRNTLWQTSPSAEI
jgi:hypothetical protein